MNPLLHRLGVVRRRFQVVTFFSGVFAVMALVVGAAVAIGVFDYLNHVPRLLRASALVGILAGSGFLIFRLLVLPLGRRSDNLSLALRIEAMHPELNDALASTIQFLDEPESPAMGDKAMRAQAIERATRQAASFDFHKILDYRFLGMTAGALFLAVAAAGHFLYHEPDLSQTALLRLAAPFGDHPWTRIGVVDPVERVAVGQPFRLKISLDGILPPAVKVEVRTQKTAGKQFDARPDTIAPVKVDPSKRSTNVVVPLDVTRERQVVQFRIVGGDGAYPPREWQTLKVLQPPAFASLEGLPSPQIELHYPQYTQFASPHKLSPGTLPLDVIQGTEVVFRAAADRPLKSAFIELLPGETEPLLRTSTIAALIGDPTSLPQIGPAAFLSAFSWFVPVELDQSRKIMSARFRPWVRGSYVVHLRDDDDLEKQYPASLTVAVDPPPVVQLRRPGVSQSFLPTAEVPIHIFADDELAVHAVALEYRKKNAQGDWLDPAPRRVTVYHPEIAAAAMRNAVNPAASLETFLPARSKRLELSMLWSLKKNRFEVGDIITLQAIADDYCDIFTPRLPGRSSEVEIRIVSKDALDRQLDDNLVQAQQELGALKKIEDDVQKLLEEIPKDKHDAKAFDRAVEAEEKVRQVQQRIGERATDGLREKLEAMQRTMNDNKLPNSEMKDQVKNLAQELERLAQEDLPKLEQNLNDLRKELSGGKADPKQKSPLDKSKAANRDVQKTLEELTRSLNRWADLAQLKGQTRELQEKQENLAKETEKLKDQIDQAMKDDNRAAMNMLKEDAVKQAKEQAKLDQEAKGLLERIADAKKQQDEVARREAAAGEDGDKDAQQRADDAKDAWKKLRGAEGVAKTEDLNAKLKDAARDLAGREPHPNAALDKQKQAAKTLDRMAQQLEGQKDDDIERLRKKKKEADAAQAGIDKLKKKVNDVQKDQKAGANNKDVQKQQAQDLREAAEDLRDQARRLQRLQEPKAARELQKAAENLENAAKKIEGGEEADAQNEEMEAQEHIQRAQEQLEHLQQELAREQLAQIKDRLVGLKERQDAAVERTKELQAKVETRKSWSAGLLDTLDADRQSQVELANEAKSLEEKLKGAMVFEHIMKKAGKAMEQAGATMAERKTAGKDRRTPELYKAEQPDEQKRYDETLRQQKLAADRLDRLLDALKDAPQQAAKRENKKPPEKKDKDGKDPEEQGGMRPSGDGIPPMAQLKALKAEQVEVYERTKEFSRANPDPMNLDERRQTELRELTEEQGRLRQLFEQMTQRKEGDMP